MIKIVSLETFPQAELVEAFQNAFADYPFTFSDEQLKSMMKRRGFDASLSFGAIDNGKLVGFTFIGTGLFNSLPSAYDVATGTIKQYRGQGVAPRIFDAARERLKGLGVRQFVLEVLSENEIASGVYLNQGFKASRLFQCHSGDKTQLSLPDKHLPAGYELRAIGTKELISMDLDRLRDFYPSWQNSDESIARAADDLLSMIAVDPSGKMVGYIVFDPEYGDIAQIAVDPPERRKGIATNLLQAMNAHNRSAIVKVLNIDNDCESLQKFLTQVGLPGSSSQWEMIHSIDAE